MFLGRRVFVRMHKWCGRQCQTSKCSEPEGENSDTQPFKYEACLSPAPFFPLAGLCSAGVMNLCGIIPPHAHIPRLLSNNKRYVNVFITQDNLPSAGKRQFVEQWAALGDPAYNQESSGSYIVCGESANILISSSSSSSSSPSASPSPPWQEPH